MKPLVLFVALLRRKVLAVAALALALIVLGSLVALAIGAPWAFNTGSASPSTLFSCDVKASCGAGEVELLRMSGTTNAHASRGNPMYGYKLCCGGLANLGKQCSGNHATVLTLSGTDNAHVASDGSYSTKVCLSLSNQNGAVNCTYGTSCQTDYECLATISGSTNAHVAACGGTYPYGTKVCCQASCVDDLECDCMSDAFEGSHACLDPAKADASGNPDGDQLAVYDVPRPLLSFAEMTIGSDPCVANPQMATDNDEDGFSDGAELFLGTDPADDCPDTLNDDAWPPDLNGGMGCGAHDGKIDILDVLCFKPKLLRRSCEGQYNHRYDFNADGSVDILDVLLYRPVIMTQCTNP